MKEEHIFHEALEKPADGRAVFLDAACGEDAELRERVEVLLQAHANPGSFLASPAHDVGIDATLDQPITEKPGMQIGPYKLLQELGEGGMGVVYMAEQKEPIKRRVALKIIKPGMDTRQVIARFEAERQALAMMDHPNIAKVLDAGTTESGRPYFVMELVNGIPVTQYCDEQHLTPKERLELFIPICQAVQHAHQKGIIHRDLKPSNVLVALYDSRAVPKVIDFGVAKATSQTLTEKTVFTQLGQIVGTLEYMSPEQAQRNQLDIDTRSDIYSLGVLLYELLTGDTPFDRQRLRSAAFDEMLRIIREEEPPKPSTKLSTVETLPTIAANRSTEPKKLNVLVRGELDWIVMKALEKDRARRYETASKFAEDIQHYLNDEPVVACPPSAAYRFKKFAGRNKGVLATLTLIGAALVIVIVQALLMAKTAVERAQGQIAVNQEIAETLGEVDRLRLQAQQAGLEDREAWSAAEKAAERARGLSANQLATRESVERVTKALAELEQAQRDRQTVAALESLRDKLGREVSTTWTRTPRSGNKTPLSDPGYAQIFVDFGLDPQSTTPAESAKQIADRPHDVRESLVIALDAWARYFAHSPSQRSEAQQAEQKWVDDVLEALDDDPWRRRLRRLLKNRSRAELLKLLDDPAIERQPPHVLLVLASALQLRQLKDATALLKRAQLKYPNDYWLNRRLAEYHRPDARSLSRYDEPDAAADAVRFASIAVVLRPKEPRAVCELGTALTFAGRIDEAIAVYRHGLELDLDKHQRHELYVRLAGVLDKHGDTEGAIDAYRRATSALPASDLRTSSRFHAYHLLYDLLVRLDRTEELIEFLREAIDRSPDCLELHNRLARAYRERKDWKKAAAAMSRVIALAGEEGLSNMGWALAGEIFFQAGRGEEARAAFQHFAAACPTLIASDAYYELQWGQRSTNSAHASKEGEMLWLTLDYVDQARLAIEVLPRNVRAHNVLATYLVPDVMKKSYRMPYGSRHDYEEVTKRLPANRYEEALQSLETACVIDENDLATHYNLAYTLAGVGRHEEALGEYQRAAEIEPNSSTLFMHMGRTLRSLDRHEEAARVLQKSLELARRNWEYYFENLEKKNDSQTVETEVSDWRAGSLWGADWTDDVHRDLVDSLNKANRTDEAIDSYYDFIALKESMPFTQKQQLYHLRNTLGIALWKADRLDEAEVEFQKCIKLDPDQAAAPSNLASLYLQRKEPEGAVALLNEALRLAPESAGLYAARGNAHQQLKEWDKAIEDYRQLIKIQPRCWGWSKLLDIEFARGASAETVQTLVAEAEVALGRPAVLDLVFQRAASHLAFNHLGQYRDVCREAALQFADSTEPMELYVVARAAALTNEPVIETERLVEMASRAVDARPTPWHQHVLGLCLLRGGQPDAAVERFNQSLSDRWVPAANWLGLAMAHAAGGRDSQAKEWLRKAQDWVQENPLDSTSKLFPPDRIECQLLLREAEQLIEGSSPNEDSVIEKTPEPTDSETQAK